MQTISKHSNRELWWSFTTILLVTFAYLGGVVWMDGIPPASEIFGHGLGILGFILMLMTEVLYSIRKRSRRASWGRTSSWLNFHIFTGIVGPYMVLLHASWKFNGLAGLTLLMTALVVLSGFIGRYIFTALPRTVEGDELGTPELQVHLLEQSIAAALLEREQWGAANPESASRFSKRLGISRLDSQQATHQLIDSYRPGFLRGLRREWALRSLDTLASRSWRQLFELIEHRQMLRRQIKSLATTRRLFSLWHTVHIPMGLALFTAAFIHIAAAIYYATLLR